jgi:2-phospho-L-lactate guanylyltransferase
MIPALVPAKALQSGKTRLRASLGAATAEALAVAMLQDVLSALLAAERVGAVAVVTPDPALADVAKAIGARALLGDDPGLNASLLRGADELRESRDEGLLIVLGDVAGIRSNEVDTLIETLEGLGPKGVVLAPSSDGGSAALARRPVDIIPPRFGKNSAALHREQAKRAGAPFCELSLASLAVDVDAADDLKSLLEGAGAGAHTSEVLRGRGLG